MRANKVVDTRKKQLVKALLKGAYKLCFHEELVQIITQLW